jgi:hypothetical protein
MHSRAQRRLPQRRQPTIRHLTTLRGAGRMSDREDGTSGLYNDCVDRLLCAGRAHCGGAAVGRAAAEDALAEGETPLATGVVRLGGRTAVR